MLKHYFLVYKKTLWSFGFWDTWPCAQKHFFSFFKVFCILEVLMKTGYFNIRFCIFSNIKILLDINQNDIKNTRENCKIPKKNIFEYFFKKNWAGPGPPILGWAWPGPYTVGWTQPSRVDWACRTLPRARRRGDTSSVAGIRCWGLSVVKKGVAT